MELAVCCGENVYAVAMVIACRHSDQELIISLYVPNINQMRVAFIPFLGSELV